MDTQIRHFYCEMWGLEWRLTKPRTMSKIIVHSPLLLSLEWRLTKPRTMSKIIVRSPLAVECGLDHHEGDQQLEDIPVAPSWLQVDEPLAEPS